MKSDSVLTSNLSFTLNVQNLFDAQPPEFHGATGLGYDATQGSTFSIGRIVQFGVRKNF